MNRILATAKTRDDDRMDKLLEAHELRKVIRVGAWVKRFVNNSKCPINRRKTGPLSTAEIQDQYLWWTKRAQRDAAINGEIEKSKIQLNLQPNDAGVVECRERIEGDYPVFLPQNHLFTRKLVEQVHLTTLHGGVGITMAKVRDQYWVPKLRQLVKRVRSDCWGCKRFRVQSYENPPPPETCPLLVRKAQLLSKFSALISRVRSGIGQKEKPQRKHI